MKLKGEKFFVFAVFFWLTMLVSAAEWPVLKTCEGECLRRIRMPLGGVGTGTISLAGNGALVDWEIRNTPDRGFTPTVNDAATGFWLRTEDAEGKVTARLLEGPIDSGLYEGAEGASVPNHGFPRFRECVFKAAYPFAQVELTDPAVPVRATLEAMNPLIPGDSAASGIPAALLRWKLVNPTTKPLKVSVLGFLVNAAGGECVKGPVFIKAREAGAVAGVTIGSSELAPVDTTLGQTSLAIPGSVGEIHEATVIRDDAWLARLKAFWTRFVETGRAENDLPPMKHELKAVALSVSFTLAPGETKRVPFVLAWHFPHRYGWTKKNYRSERVSGPFAAENDLGNWYATKFTSSFSAALRLLKDIPELEAKTVDFVNGVLKSKAPDVIKEAALFNLSTLRSETCFRTTDGHFYGWEGIFDDCGSCFGNCTHVWGYEHALIDLWPDLAKDMTELQFGHHYVRALAAWSVLKAWELRP